MRALDFWKTVVKDKANFLESLFSLLVEHKIRYCVIGGQAVNAYVEPLVSLDLDLVVAADAHPLLAEHFQAERFPHSLNLSMPESNLRVQVQTDSRYAGFLERSAEKEVLGMKMSVARLEDVLQGKIWAAAEPSRTPGQQKKDLLDIERLLEAFPHLREHVPAEILDRLL